MGNSAHAELISLEDLLYWATPPVWLGLSRRNSGKTPETLSERFLEFSSRVRLGSPKPYIIQCIWGFQSISIFLSPQYGWRRLFFQKWFQRGPVRAGHGIPSSTEGISDIQLSWQPGKEIIHKSLFWAPPDLCLPRCVFRDCPYIW